MALFNPLNDAFGIDIGDHTFKVVQISRRPGVRSESILQAWGSISVPEGIMDHGEVVNQVKASDHVRKLLGQCQGRIRGRTVVACLPEAKSFIKIIEAKKHSAPDQLKKTIRQEIEQNIPLPIDEIYFDWQVLPEKIASAEPADIQVPTTQQPNDPTTPQTEEQPKEPGSEATAPESLAAPPADTERLILAAAPKRLVESYTQMLENADLLPIALEIESSAIARAILPEDRTITEPIGILDMGATHSNLAIVEDGVLQMSISIPLSGNEMTEEISRQLSVNLADADIIKRECGLDAHRCEDRMWKILLPLIDDMCSKIRNALRFYKIGSPHSRKIEHLYLCGGGAHFRDIDTVLSRKLTIRVHRGDSLVNVKKIPKQFQRETSLTYTTAIGLALRSTDEIRRNRGSFRA